MAIQAALLGFSSSLPYMSSNQNKMSSAVNESPLDHFMPRRRVKVIVLPPSLISQALATLGMTFVTVASQ